jgi:hypothetical protein
MTSVDIAEDRNKLRRQEVLAKKAEYARIGFQFELDTRKTRTGTSREVVGQGPFAGLRWKSLYAAAKATGYSVSNVCGHCNGRRSHGGQRFFAYEDEN